MKTIILDNSQESADWLHTVVAANPANRKRYFIEVSRKDTGLVSYFPGAEIKDNPDGDWIDDVLVPAVESIAKRKAAKIREVPITFWVTVRGTARRRAEVFLFVTPACPGAMIEQALSKALEPIKHGKVHAAQEPIPEEAVPCLQIFRKRLLKLYYSYDGHEGLYLPMIEWRDNAPSLLTLSIPQNSELITVEGPIEEADRLIVEGRILEVSTGESCRRFQQALTPVARRADSGAEQDPDR